jgi:hypothetical protein
LRESTTEVHATPAQAGLPVLLEKQFRKLLYRILLARGNIRRRWLRAGVEVHTEAVFWA